MRVAILTVSDRSSRGERADASGPAIADTLSQLPAVIVATAVVADEVVGIAAQLSAWADSGSVDLIFTTGGTGLAPRDVTPEATLGVIDRHVPGIGEAIRAASLSITPMAMLSRGTAGIRGRTLIVNLPGSPKAVRECLSVILPVLPHAIGLLTGAQGDHG